MKKYIKVNNALCQQDYKIRIYSDISCVPNNLSNEIIIVENDGLYKSNSGTNELIMKDTTGGTASSYEVGMVIPFFGNTIPNGFLECDGSQFSSTDFPALYNFLGTDYVPDFRECVLRGADLSSQNDGVGVFSDWAIQDHGHQMISLEHTHTKSTNNHCHANSCRDCLVCPTCGWSTGYACTMRKYKYGTSQCAIAGTAVNVTATNEKKSNPTIDLVCWTHSAYLSDEITRNFEHGVIFLIYTGEN